MCQEKYSTNKREFKQLTYKERVKIETLYNDQHLNYTQIGEILGKHRTTISREIKLGLIELESSYLPIWKYCAEVAQRRNEENETAKGTNLKIGNDMKLANFIEKEIKEEKIEEEARTESEEMILENVTQEEEYTTYHIHIVKENENVETICTMYNSNLSMLKEYNDLSAVNTGEKIIIPCSDES